MLTNKKDITEWLWQMQIKNYIIHDDLIVDVNDNVDISYQSLTTIPIQFGTIHGSFNCNDNQLYSLQGCPHVIRDNFNCGYNNLLDLNYSPLQVGKIFNCRRNKLTSLKGSPIKVSEFDCSVNQLTNLTDGPKIVSRSYNCSRNHLISLKGSPKNIQRSFDCSDNQLINLKYSPQNIKEDFTCFNNPLESLANSFDFGADIIYLPLGKYNTIFPSYIDLASIAVPFEIFLSYAKKEQLHELLSNELNHTEDIHKKTKI